MNSMQHFQGPVHAAAALHNVLMDVLRTLTGATRKCHTLLTAVDPYCCSAVARAAAAAAAWAACMERTQTGSTAQDALSTAASTTCKSGMYGYHKRALQEALSQYCVACGHLSCKMTMTPSSLKQPSNTLVHRTGPYAMLCSALLCPLSHAMPSFKHIVAATMQRQLCAATASSAGVLQAARPTHERKRTMLNPATCHTSCQRFCCAGCPLLAVAALLA
jgi:hypothetical protein